MSENNKLSTNSAVMSIDEIAAYLKISEKRARAILADFQIQHVSRLGTRPKLYDRALIYSLYERLKKDSGLTLSGEQFEFNHDNNDGNI